MGYVLSFGRRRRVIKQLGNTAYYLTNARAFIVSGADGPTVTTIDLRRMPQTSLWLADGTVGNNYGLAGLPNTFVLDSRGRIAKTLIGPQSVASVEHALREVQ